MPVKTQLLAIACIGSDAKGRLVFSVVLKPLHLSWKKHFSHEKNENIQRDTGSKVLTQRGDD